jgi:zinc transporter ZupT
MVILGLVLLGVGAVVIVVGVLTSDAGTSGTVMLAGFDMNPTTLFLLGVAAGSTVLVGLLTLKMGAKHQLRLRREHRELTKLSEKLDRVEAENKAEEPDSN